MQEPQADRATEARQARAAESERSVAEGGGGEAEGFELAEQLLQEHASHGDQQSAHAVLHHSGAPEEDDPARADGEADHEHSGQRARESTSEER